MIKVASEISGIKINGSLTSIGVWVTIWKRNQVGSIHHTICTGLNSKWIQGENVNQQNYESAKRTLGIYNTGSGKAILVAAHNPEARKENIHKN